jgi:hypothetical protein
MKKSDLVNMGECLGNYEGAMNYDCAVCQKECNFRKGGAKSSEIIAVMSFLVMISIIVVVVIGKAIVGLGKWVGLLNG